MNSAPRIPLAMGRPDARSLAYNGGAVGRARRLHHRGQRHVWRPRGRHGISRLRCRAQCRADLCREGQGHGRRHRQPLRRVAGRAIVERNNLQAPYALQALARRCQVPGARYVRTRRGQPTPPDRDCRRSAIRWSGAGETRSASAAARYLRNPGLHARRHRPPPASRRRSARPAAAPPSARHPVRRRASSGRPAAARSSRPTGPSGRPEERRHRHRRRHGRAGEGGGRRQGRLCRRRGAPAWATCC